MVGPGAAVAAELAFVAFDLDEEEAAGGDDEGVTVGEGGADVFEGFGFPGEGGFGDTFPALR